MIENTFYKIGFTAQNLSFIKLQKRRSPDEQNIVKNKKRIRRSRQSRKKIADVLLNNDKSVPSMFIGDFAKLCDCSVATVTRFSKKLGFNGFPQLKIALAREKDFSPVGENITTEDTAAEVFAKICNDIYSSLERTKKV